jgi:hypothetical protein
MSEVPVLRADEKFFASHAKDLIVAKTAFRFVVSGRQAELFRPYLVDGEVRDAYKMGVKLQLQPILGVILVAEGAGRPVRFSERDGDIIGSVPADSKGEGN